MPWRSGQQPAHREDQRLRLHQRGGPVTPPPTSGIVERHGDVHGEPPQLRWGGGDAQPTRRSRCRHGRGRAAGRSRAVLPAPVTLAGTVPRRRQPRPGHGRRATYADMADLAEITAVLNVKYTDQRIGADRLRLAGDDHLHRAGRLGDRNSAAGGPLDERPPWPCPATARRRSACAVARRRSRPLLPLLLGLVVGSVPALVASKARLKRPWASVICEFHHDGVGEVRSDGDPRVAA